MTKSWVVWMAALVGGVAMSVGAVDDLRIQRLLTDMHHVHQMEVDMGQMAESKGDSSAVKDYGKTLVKDHQAADDKLRMLATEKNMPLKESKHKDKTLHKLSGPQFDREFIKAMIQGHQENIARLKEAQGWLPEGNVRDYVTDTLPYLQNHLAKAEEIKKGLPQ